MLEMITDPLVDLIVHGVEERNLEYKGNIAWQDATIKGRLCKSIIAMANLQDGGSIVIGVEETKKKGQFIAKGLSNENLDTFRPDDLMAWVNEYASPPVELTLQRVAYDNKNFVIIRVREFAELPVVCKKSGADAMRNGALYIRRKRTTETAEVSSEGEMREILELAADKNMRRFLERRDRIGASAPSSGTLFDQQLRGI